jgi:hypothetical protein
MDRTPPQLGPKPDAATVISAVVGASGAALYGAVVLITGVFGTIAALSAESVTLPQPVDATIPGSTATDGTTLAEGTFRMSDITVTGLDAGVRALLAGSRVLDLSVHLTVAIGVILLCFALVKGRPFIPLMRRMLIVISMTVIVGGLLGSGLLGFANMEIAHSLDRAEFPMVANIDFTAAIVGVALALVAAAFELGERLQRDSEGLV